MSEEDTETGAQKKMAKAGAGHPPKGKTDVKGDGHKTDGRMPWKEATEVRSVSLLPQKFIPGNPRKPLKCTFQPHANLPNPRLVRILRRVKSVSLTQVFLPQSPNL